MCLFLDFYRRLKLKIHHGATATNQQCQVYHATVYKNLQQKLSLTNSELMSGESC